MRYLPRLDILCKLCGSLAIHWRTYLLVCGGAGCSLVLARDTECLLMTGLLVCLHTSSIMCCAAATLIRSYQYQPRYLCKDINEHPRISQCPEKVLCRRPQVLGLILFESGYCTKKRT